MNIDKGIYFMSSLEGFHAAKSQHVDVQSSQVSDFQLYLVTSLKKERQIYFLTLLITITRIDE